jgi:outer membrane protein OmpA-like peptidoglycan-associated protein
MSEVYCSGFITKQDVHAIATVIDDSRAPEQVRSSARSYIYLKGSEIQEGKEYLLLRHTHDPNRNQSFPGQLGLISSLGELYQDLGRAKVIAIRKNIAVAEIDSACSETLPGDIAVPFQERPRPEFKQTNFEPFAVLNGKTKGRIVMARDLDTLVGARRVVYLNVGEAQGVKPGDYFRALRDYSSIANNPVEALPFKAPPYDPTQKNPPNFQFSGHAKELPVRSIGELMVLSTTANTSTALTTYVPEDIHLGDTVEMIEAKPFPPPEEAATTAALPPTINCSVSRSTIQVGESANITCNGVPEEGHTLTYSYQASAGQVTPRDNRATLTPNAPGPITVTATAVDDRNLSAQTTVNVDVQAAPVAPNSAETAGTLTPSMLNELTFRPNSSRVDNRAKAALDDDALRLQRDANATLIIEGSANPSEDDALALQRAENAKTYLTRSKGIDPSRIQTRAAQSKTGAKVVVVLVPAGAPPQQ